MDSPLLERDHELASIDRLLGETVQGRGATLVIQGAPGVGKSCLLSASATRAGACGISRVACFRCGELEQEFPWSAALGLLTAAVMEVAPAQRRGLFAGAAVPARRLVEDPACAVSDLDPFAVIHGIYVVYERMSEAAPLLLVLDDAHWSDAQSLRQLLYLTRRLPRIAVGLLVATRAPSGDGDQRELLDTMIAADASHSARLAVLSPSAVCTIVRRDAFPSAGDALCEACARLTGGNPFLLRELLLSLRAGGADPESALDRLAAVPPESIIRSVLVRLARLSTSASDLARAVAVLDDGATLSEAAALAGMTLSDAAREADGLAVAQILVPGEPLRFVHPLVRSAIYADTPEAHRATAHATAAELLEASGAAPELVALHLLQVPLTRNPRTVERLRTAARSASRRGAPAAAASFLTRALQEAANDDERARLLVELAEAESRLGDPAAVEHLRAALGLTPHAEHARILLALGWAEHHAGRFGDAADAFERGMAAVADEQVELAAELEAGYLQSASLETSRSADVALRIRALEEGSAPLHGPSQRSLLAQVLFGHSVSGRDRDGLIALALRLWDGGRLLEEEGADSQTVWHVVGALSWADAYEDTYRIIAAALKSAETEGASLAYARGRYARAWPNLWTGRLHDAAADAREAINIWYGGLETYLPAAIYWLVRAELEIGHIEAAEQALALAGRAERWQDTGMAGFHVAAQGHIAGHRGQPDRALAAHQKCGELLGALNVLNPSVMPWRTFAAESADLLGERELARQLAAEELSLARTIGCPRALGVSLRTSGRLAPAATAAPLLEESVQVLAGCGAQLEHARSIVELGAALRRTGRRRSARPLLQRGIDLAEPMGAATLLVQAADELDAAGGRRAGRPAGGREALTASEHRVCALAAEGHPNRYIAGRLAVSVKAVDWHLSQSYRKLGIASRQELAGVLGLSQDAPRLSQDAPAAGAQRA